MKFIAVLKGIDGFERRVPTDDQNQDEIQILRCTVPVKQDVFRTFRRYDGIGGHENEIVYHEVGGDERSPLEVDWYGFIKPGSTTKVQYEVEDMKLQWAGAQNEQQ